MVVVEVATSTPCYMELAGVEQQMRKDGRETWQGIDDCP
jgi:hypothetical protein